MLSTGPLSRSPISTGATHQLDVTGCNFDAVVMTPPQPSRTRFFAAALILLAVLTLLVPDAACVSATPRDERWQWPTGTPVPVVAGFAPPAHDWLPGRRGITLQYPAGSPVYACAAGTVTVAGPVAGRGVVSIRHSVGGRDIWSTYLPITPTVAVGEHVEKGDIIGTVEGDSQTLHWGAKTGRRTYINPIRMTLGHPRLLPWDDAP